MDTLTYILNKFNINLEREVSSRIELPFSRGELAYLFPDLGFKIGAEIGVEQGEYSEVLIRANPNLHLYLVDAWKAYKGYRDHTRQEKLERFFTSTIQRLSPYPNKKTFIRDFSMNAVKMFDDESLDFVYIDANHDFAHVTEDIYHWSKKVRSGGIVAGHDYYKDAIPNHIHVPYVLHGYTQAYNIKPWFVFEDSWIFVKQ